MPTNTAYPVFMPNPVAEHVPGSTPLPTGAYPWPGQSPAGAGQGTSGYRALMGANGQIQFVSSADYDQAMRQVQEFINHANAYDREKFVAQYKDLAAARDNAVQLERMRDQTSRYGIDKQAETELKRLTENARQFDSTHALDLQRFGLDQQKFGLQYANDVAAYESSPDKYAMGADFINAAGRAVQGLGQQPYGTGTTFTAKTPEDFARLAGYPGTPPAQPGGAGGQTGSPGAGNGASTDAGAAAPPDPRIAAVKKMFDAIPPSETPGMDPGDWAVMKAAQALYSSPLRSGTYRQLSPGNKAILGSYVQKSGRYLPDYIAQQTREMISQGNVRAA
jgi:hypothetical protein